MAIDVINVNDKGNRHGFFQLTFLNSCEIKSIGNYDNGNVIGYWRYLIKTGGLYHKVYFIN